MSQPSQSPHPAHPTLLNLPQPPSNPDTPSEMPGTPTSTTTSLSALSTTAIKDGHRGALHNRGHQHSLSTNSLEAERADRISRLAGLSTVSTLRGPPAGFTPYNAITPQNVPVSTILPGNNPATAAGGLTPAYFDATGQPIAATKISTVGSASATESVGGRTTTETGGDHDTLTEADRNEDMLTEMDSASASGYMGTDPMDEDLDNLATQSVSGFEDRMSDDGSASLVGFGEGAGSTVSGPIYHRRPLPPQNTATGPGGVWGLERRSSGLSEVAAAPMPANVSVGTGTGRRDLTRPSERETTGTDTPVSQSAVRERREARMVDGVALDSAAPPTAGAGAVSATTAANDDIFVDTTTRGPVPIQPTISAIRETQQPHSHQQATQAQYIASTASPPSPREAAERIVRERLDEGESRVGRTAMASPKGGERLGRFYFEDR
ncbi:Myb dna-binding domain containing protein [Madurella fahalii]|uniref:Myb dna-binding domain containing protein n=1 Tax=Madurella fahalii TaxID=1157608 RepID=A0ABQ0GI99_9PEZI